MAAGGPIRRRSRVIRRGPARRLPSSEFKQPADDPDRFAKAHGLKVESLDDDLSVLDRLFRFAKEKGVVCLKTTRAYERTLRFEDVSKERAARAFGRPRAELTPQEAAIFPG